MAFSFLSTTGVVTASSTAVTTSSVTIPADSTVCVASWSFGSGRTVTISGASLTWTQEASYTATAPSTYFHTAYSASSTSGAITATFNTGSSAIICVWVVTGALSSDRVGANFTGTASATTATWSPTTYTSTVDNSRLIFIGCYDTSGTPTISSTDLTAIDQGYHSGSTAQYFMGRKATDTATSGSGTSTDVTTSATDSGSSGWVGMAVELKPVPNQTVTLSGIASAEAFGTAQLNQSISLSGIASEEVFGSTTLFYNQTVELTGIASGEAFGTPQLNQSISLSGIVSGEAFGTAQFNMSISLTGIPSGEGFGSLTIPAEWVLRSPSVQETPMANNILHIRYGIHRGISILKRQNGTYYSTRYPALTEIEEAAAYYRGGAKHPISLTVANELIAAGFGAYVTQEPV